MKNKALSFVIMLLTFIGTISLSIQSVDAASLKIKTFKTNVSSTYVNSTIKISANASGGKGIKKYKYYYKLSGKTKTIKNYSTAKSASFKPTKAGTYTVYVAVKDSKKTITKSKKVTVYSQVSGKISLSNYINKKYVSSNYVKTKSTVKISASGSGGKGTKKYKYYYKYNNKTTTIKSYTTSKSVTFKPSKAGKYTVYVTVKDANNKTKTVSKTLYVYSTALSGTLSYSNKTPLLNDTVKVTVKGKNGVSGYKYKFTDSKGKVVQAYSTKNYYSYVVDKLEGVKYYVTIKDAGGKEKKYTISSKIKNTELDIENLSLKVGTISKMNYKTIIESPKFTYQIEDESICNVDRKLNTFMPLNKGTTNVIVSTTYNGGKISRTFKVTVSDNSSIKIVADLSHNNGKNLTIKDLKNAGVDYVILRVGYGSDLVSQDDSHFKKYVDQCKAEGMNFGVYLYSYANTLEKGKSEAMHIDRQLKYVNDSGASQLFTLPIYYDLEDKNTTGKLKNDEIAEIFNIYIKTMNDLGYSKDKLGVYANRDWFVNKLTDPVFKDYKIWYARYGVTSVDKVYGKQVNMWQTGENYTINGQKIDLNYLYK